MRVVLGFGSNLGSRWCLLQAAMDTIEMRFGQTRRSTVFRSPAMTLNGTAPGPDFLNAALSFECDVSLEALLHHTQGLEDLFGRKRDVRWGDRTLDIDILWAPMTSEAPRVPHPGLATRAFALAPALEVAPELEALSGQLAELGGAPKRVEPPELVAGHGVIEARGCLDGADALALAWGATAQSSGEGEWTTAHRETPMQAAYACVDIGGDYLVRPAPIAARWEVQHLGETSAVLRHVEPPAAP